MNLSKIKIERLIAHQIIKNGTEDDILFNTELSGQMIDVEETIESTIITRILQTKDKLVEMDRDLEEMNSSYEDIFNLIQLKNEEFLELSKKIVNNLSKLQTTRRIDNSSILIMTGKNESNQSLLFIVKADMDESFEVQNVDGKTILRKIEKAIMGKEKKLFKIALFINDKSTKETYVYDSNLSFGESKSMAKYFYKSFLGCKLKDNSNAIIEKIRSLTRNYIQNNISDKFEAFNKLNILDSTIGNTNHHIFSPTNLADEIFDSENKDGYFEMLQNNDVSSGDLVKDIVYFKKKYYKKTIKFTNDVKITYKEDDIEVLNESEDGEYTLVKIKGKLSL